MSRIKTWSALLTACALAMGGVVHAAPAEAAPAAVPKKPARQAPPPRTFEGPTFTGDVIVKFKTDTPVTGTSPASASETRAIDEVGRKRGKRLKVAKGLRKDALLVKGAAAQDAPMIASDLEKRADVLYAEPVTRMLPSGLGVNDPDADSWQWDLEDSKVAIDAPAAWAKTHGAGVNVAVIDTGIRPHPEFRGRILQGADFISDPTRARDGGGRDSDATDVGDWTEANACTSYFRSSSWHGTHVTGTIAAATNDARGMAGIAGKANIVPIRVLGACGGTSDDIADAIAWAAGAPVEGMPDNPNPAKVINLSLGGRHECFDYTQNAIDEANRRGAVVVVAAGNDNEPAANSSPANCQGVITVAASDYEGQRASFSNYGEPVTLAAPGTGIYSTLNDGDRGPGNDSYDWYQGTSMAAPHVAGVAALMMALKPSITPVQVKAALVKGAKPAPYGCDGCGAGLLDAGLALDAAGAVLGTPTVSTMNPMRGGAASDTTVTLKGTKLDLATGVTFGGVAGTILDKAADTLTVRAPKRSSAGTVPVVVTSAGGPASAGSFTYLGAPVISRMDVRSGNPDGGTLVTITGSGFSGLNVVTFGSSDGQVVEASDTMLRVKTPAKLANDPSVVDVQVFAEGGASAVTSTTKFTYVVPKPTLSRLSLRSGSPAGGEDLTITGKGLEKLSTLTFGDVTLKAGASATSSTFVVDESGTQVSLKVPGFSGSVTANRVSVPVSVTNTWGESSRPVSYQYVVPVPTVSRLSQREGDPDGGYALTLTGRELATATGVTVAGEPVEFTKNNDGTLTITKMPAVTGGLANTPIVVKNDWAVSRPATFKYAIPMPQISRFSVRNGTPAGGEDLVITGRNLVKLQKLTFGEHTLEAGKDFTVNDAATEITLKAPAYTGQVSTSRITVDVTATNKWVTSRPAKYTYVVPVPTVSRLSQTSGSRNGGDHITVTGVNLQTVTEVWVGETKLASDKFGFDQFSGLFWLVTPPQAWGQVDAVDIVVKNPWVESRITSAARFTYTGEVRTLPEVTAKDDAVYGKAYTASVKGLQPGQRFVFVNEFAVDGSEPMAAIDADGDLTHTVTDNFKAVVLDSSGSFVTTPAVVRPATVVVWSDTAYVGAPWKLTLDGLRPGQHLVVVDKDATDGSQPIQTLTENGELSVQLTHDVRWALIDATTKAFIAPEYKHIVTVKESAGTAGATSSTPVVTRM